MCRQLFWFAALVILAVPLVPSLGRGDEAPKNVPAHGSRKKEPAVYVEVYVAEISVSKFRALGFDWDNVRSMFESFESEGQSADQKLLSFIEALRRDDLVRVLSEPVLSTISGRPASLHVGDGNGHGLRLDVLPQVLDSQKIRLEYRIERSLVDPVAGHTDTGERPPQFVLDSAAVLAHGRACCAAVTQARRTTENGKTEETEIVVLIRADFQPPAEGRTAERLTPPRPTPERRYPEIEIPNRR